MVYVEYSYYQDVYSGKLPQTTFDELVKQQCRNLDIPTFYRLQDETYPKTDEDWEKVKDCICEMIDLQNGLNEKLKGIEDITPLGVKSESVDGFSKSYMTDEEKTKLTEELNKDISKLIKGRLGTTGLLFRG